MRPTDVYLALMSTIRSRFDVVQSLRDGPGAEFVRAESAAFHGRKIVEAIAFGCLVALDHSFNTVPRDAKGQWNAESIFVSLQRKGLDELPSPSIIRRATAEDEQSTAIVIEGIPERRLTHSDLIKIYQRLHAWLHELNPYTVHSHEAFCVERAPELWSDLSRLHGLVEKHFMSIRDAGFFCVLNDNVDHLTKVHPLTR
jgi:hypothetical protein